MSVEENKVTLRRNFEEIWNKQNLSLIPELVSPNYVGINNQGVFKGLEGYEQLVKTGITSTPDLQYTVDEVVGEGDTLMAKVTMTGTFTGKFAGLDISGKKFKSTSVFISKYENGKVRESIVYANPLETFKQLGIQIPPEWGMG